MCDEGIPGFCNGSAAEDGNEGADEVVHEVDPDQAVTAPEEVVPLCHSEDFDELQEDGEFDEEGANPE